MGWLHALGTSQNEQRWQPGKVVQGWRVAAIIAPSSDGSALLHTKVIRQKSAGQPTIFGFQNLVVFCSDLVRKLCDSSTSSTAGALTLIPSFTVQQGPHSARADIAKPHLNSQWLHSGPQGTAPKPLPDWQSTSRRPSNSQQPSKPSSPAPTTTTRPTFPSPKTSSPTPRGT